MVKTVDEKIDSMIRDLPNKVDDTLQVHKLNRLHFAYLSINTDISLNYLLESIKIVDKFDDKNDIKFGTYIMLAFYYNHGGNIPKSVEVALKILEWYKGVSNQRSMALNIVGMGLTAQGDYVKVLPYFREINNLMELQLAQHEKVDERGYLMAPYSLGSAYLNLNKLDSAEKYARIGLSRIDTSIKYMETYNAMCYLLMGKVFGKNKYQDSSAIYFALAHNQTIEGNSSATIAETDLSIANYYHDVNQLDSAIVYAQKAYSRLDFFHGYEKMIESATLLKSLYQSKKDFRNALFFSDLANAAQDSISGAVKTRQVQTMVFNDQLKQAEIKNAVLSEKQKNRIGLLGILLGGTIFLASILYRFFALKQRDNKLLSAQNEKIELQKVQLESSLTGLKKAQTQLIHAEKMASLGELTAGIAHEIQNPLNFVNNFSQLNADLLQEVKVEREKSNSERDESLINGLLNDLEKNSGKINNHGQRASNIVKGMLEHSRTENHEKQMVDINKLVTDYLQLALQAGLYKERGDSISIIRDLDNQVPKIEAIPDDLGRVFINIFNNALYALSDKSKKMGEELGFVPKLSIHTKYHPVQKTRAVEIRIVDNGTGIPEEIRNKIFQPFFTTKPTGQGTGLGLSISYDIITKGHGGSISIISDPGGNTEFAISLPVDNGSLE